MFLPLFRRSIAPPVCLGLEHHVGHAAGAFAFAIALRHPSMNFGGRAISLQPNKPAYDLRDRSEKGIRRDRHPPG